MTEEQISKLPPELRPAAELEVEINKLSAISSTHSQELLLSGLRHNYRAMVEMLWPKALTYCLQMQERAEKAEDELIGFIPMGHSPCGHCEQYAWTDDGGKHIICLVCETKESKATIATLTRALKEIGEGKGAYSRDPLTHCSNTVEHMKELAHAALSHTPEGRGQ